MRRAVLVATLTAGGLVGGCCVGVHLDKSGGAAELRKLDEQWSAAAAKNDLEATLSFYADDAVLLPGSKADVDPVKYAASRHPKTAPDDQRRYACGYSQNRKGGDQPQHRRPVRRP